MKSSRRQKWLPLVAAGTVGLVALDRLVVAPVVRRCKEQTARIEELRRSVEQGTMLLAREGPMRQKWAEMRRAALRSDASTAEDGVLKAAGRWARASGITFTSLIPQWREHETGCRTLECRASVQGGLLAIARFLYELEKDPAAVRLEGCEITARDDRGGQLLLNARFSALRLPEPGGEAR